MSSRNIGIVGLFFIVALVCNTGSKSIVAEGVCFEENQLFVDDKPFFFFGIDGVPDSFESVRAHHFNTIFFWRVPGDKKLVQEAAEAGLMVIPYPYAPRWSMRYEKFIKTVEPKSAILAWNIGDDLKDKDVQKVRAAYEKIHQIDPDAGWYSQSIPVV